MRILLKGLRLNSWIATRNEILLTFFHSTDLEDHRAIRIGATKVAHPCFFFPRDIASESQGGDEREKRVECPVAKFRWRKTFKDKFVSHLQTKRTFPFFQNSYHLYFDCARKTHTKIFHPSIVNLSTCSSRIRTCPRLGTLPSMTQRLASSNLAFIFSYAYPVPLGY